MGCKGVLDNISTRSLNVLYNTLKMGVILDTKGELDIETMKRDIDILDLEIKKREKGE